MYACIFVMYYAVSVCVYFCYILRRGLVILIINVSLGKRPLLNEILFLLEERFMI